eukprot:scpid28265/ scgid30013/ 
MFIRGLFQSAGRAVVCCRERRKTLAVWLFLSAVVILGEFPDTAWHTPGTTVRSDCPAADGTTEWLPDGETQSWFSGPRASVSRVDGSKKESSGTDGRNFAARAKLIKVIRAHGQLQRGYRNGNGENLRAVVYVCGFGGFCGGLADRFEGVLVLYFAAVISNRAFFINWTKPTDLENFYVPRHGGDSLDWRLSTLQNDAMHQRMEAVDRLTLHRQKDALRCTKLVSMIMDPRSPAIVRITTNHAKSCVVRMLEQELEFAHVPADTMGLAFHWLFTESTDLIRSLKEYVTKNKWNFATGICMHVRHGGNMGVTGKASIDPVRHFDLNSFWKCAARVKTDLQDEVSLNVVNGGKQQVTVTVPRCDSHVRSWLLISDDDEVLSEAHLNLPKPNRIVHTQGVGPVLHIDKLSKYRGSERQAIADGERRVMLDHALMQRCRLLVASHSAFSLSAAGLSRVVGQRVYLVDWLRDLSRNQSLTRRRPCRRIVPSSFW